MDVYDKESVIRGIPVKSYPKTYVDFLNEEVDKVKENISKGMQPVFDSIDSMFEELENI